MIWAVLFIYLGYMLNSSSSGILLGEWLLNDSKHQFKEVIQDKERSKEAMGILDEMIRDTKDFNSEVEKTKKQVAKLVKNYHSSREEFEQCFSELQGKREASTAKILDRIPDLKKNILREEWTNAFADEEQDRP